VITTDALFARQVQRKLSNGVAGFTPRGSSSDRNRSRLMASVRAERLLKIPAEPSPELRISSAAAQTRIVSKARNLAEFPQICAIFQRDNLRRHF
jgi:hypothetical protein